MLVCIYVCADVGFFPKQFTVGVLNATLDLAALVLVGVVGFLGSEVVLSPVVSGCLPSCGGWVLVGVAAFLGSEVVLSPVVSGCLPSCGGWVLVGVAASRTKTFRNQNHRFQSKFAYCKLFGVYAGVILNGTSWKALLKKHGGLRTLQISSFIIIIIRIHLGYIYLHGVHFYGKCRWIYHTWILWVITWSVRPFFLINYFLYIWDLLGKGGWKK